MPALLLHVLQLLHLALLLEGVLLQAAGCLNEDFESVQDSLITGLECQHARSEIFFVKILFASQHGKLLLVAA